MSSTKSSSPMRSALLVFTVAYLALVASIYVISMFVQLPNSSSLGIIGAVVSAVAAGGSFATNTERPMTSGERFRFALFSTLIMFALSFAMLYGFFVYYGVPFNVASIGAMVGASEGELSEVATWLPVILGVVALLYIVVNYFAVGFGAKSQLKRAEKLAQQGK